MHKKYLAFGLPVLGALAVVGSGFSAWAFGSPTTSATSTVNVAVTAESGYGDLVAANSTATLRLDQYGYDQISNSDAGISFVVPKTSGGTVSVDDDTTYSVLDALNATFTLTDADAQVLINAGFTTYSFSTTVVLPAALCTYVDFQPSLNSNVTSQYSDDSSSVLASKTYTETESLTDNKLTSLTLTDSTNFTHTFGVDTSVSTTEGSEGKNALLTYAAYAADTDGNQTAGKPVTDTFYDTMTSFVTTSSPTISVTYSVTFA